MLTEAVEHYVSLQRSLGYKFDEQARSLLQFAEYAVARGDSFIRVERVLAWAALTPSAPRRRTLIARVRQFAHAMRAEDARHEVPPRECEGHAKAVRKPPYIYTTDDIDRIMQSARQMPTSGRIATETLATLMGLLVSTGLRISEALALECQDVSIDGLLIRKSKHGKSRFIPLHETTQVAVGRYLDERARRPVYTQAVFVSSTGQALIYTTVLATFRRLLAHAGLRSLESSSGPRIHDLRHTFAVRSLEQCRHDRYVVARHMVALSNYLGHTNVTDTYWYLEATPIIMGNIAKVGEAMQRGGAS
jgi:integrase